MSNTHRQQLVIERKAAKLEYERALWATVEADRAGRVGEVRSGQAAVKSAGARIDAIEGLLAR